MEENKVTNTAPEASEKKPRFTVKNILRILTVLCMIFVFCPAFLVSCSGQDVNVNVMTAVEGVKAYGETMVKPQPLMLLCLLLPIAVMVLLFVKKFTEKLNSTIILGCTAVDLVIWFIFRGAVKKIAEENFCTFKTTPWFVLNVIAMLLIIIANALILLGKMQMDTDLAVFFANGGAKEAIEGIAKKVTHAATGNDDKTGTATDAPKADPAGNVVGKIAAIPTKLLIGVGAAVIAVIVIIVVVVNAGKTIDVNKYLTVEASGYDGYGNATVTVDWDAIEQKYGSKISFTGAARSEFGSALSMVTPMDALQAAMVVDLDEDSNLSNGQTITYTWTVDPDLTKYLKCKVKYKDGSYTVKDLTEVGSFDAFANLDVEFSGVAPNGSANLNYTGSELSYYDFDADKLSGLSNGDVITVTIDESIIPSCAERLGKVPETNEKQYTVTGLQSYLTNLSEITDEDLAVMQQQASDVYNASVAQEWSETSHLENFTYLGDYLLTAKNADTWGTSNYLYLVYKVQARNEYSDGKESYNQVNDIYWYIRFRDLMIGEDGRLVVDVTDYATPYNRYTVDSGISTGWFSTYCWYYYGYGTLEELYKEAVTANIDAYNHQDNIDESAVPEPLAEEVQAADEGYVLPNSDKELLTEADLEGLSAEQCQIARNEIYARHGRMFKDETIQAYFNSCDWYEGTIAPDDFDEANLTETEIANKDLIVEYEKKMGYR